MLKPFPTANIYGVIKTGRYVGGLNTLGIKKEIGSSKTATGDENPL